MTWDVYTIFAVLSGATLLLMAAAPMFTRKERLEALLFGVLVLGYAVYIGNTDGTFLFPIWFFVAPFLFVAVALAGVYERWSKRRANNASVRNSRVEPGNAEPA
jgi:protein-S-isoprenylcysteine O-methyltransferase Ste14